MDCRVQHWSCRPSDNVNRGGDVCAISAARVDGRYVRSPLSLSAVHLVSACRLLASLLLPSVTYKSTSRPRSSIEKIHDAEIQMNKKVVAVWKANRSADDYISATSFSSTLAEFRCLLCCLQSSLRAEMEARLLFTSTAQNGLVSSCPENYGK